MEIIKITENQFINTRYIERFYHKDGEYFIESISHSYKISKEVFNKLIDNSIIL